ncbi:Facilitated trehalose transporter Tret1 [Papilio machaon]|uniref:Facilitated trehalose transporter Tret1 n=1 Tax=Papilio machaon TaxID=76193 RepID=A0A194QXD6_PAPMA|nr:Facilitated trehalose transporter Tret1 [Papilio machaon]
MTENTNRRVQYLAGICASLAFTFTGATISWSSPVIPKIKSGEVNIQLTNAQISWVVALAALGALPGCYIGQVLSERLGRRRTICGAAVPGIAGAAMILFTKTPEVMYVARILMGISNGITAVVTMIYLTEIADKEVRGALGMVVQVMINLGALAMYGIGPFVSYNVLNSFVTTLPIFNMLVCVWIPESPYYHLKDERYAEAKKAFMIIKGCKDQKWADQQLGLIRMHVRESMENKSTLKELLCKVKYRKAVYIIAGLKIFQYMTGSLAIQSYLEIIFTQSTSISGPYVSIVYGFVQLGAGVGATFLAGYFGRRILMIVSCSGVALSLTAVGIYFYLQDYIKINPATLSAISFVPLIGVLVFNILYAVGIGTIPYIMQAELFPINVKTVASSAATMISCILNFTVTKSYQSIKDVFGHYIVFWIFAGIAYVGVFFVYFLVPETKGKSLEEIQDFMQGPRHLETEALNVPEAIQAKRDDA